VLSARDPTVEMVSRPWLLRLRLGRGLVFRVQIPFAIRADLGPSAGGVRRLPLPPPALSPTERHKKWPGAVA